ncbi:hypothetical protein ACFQ3S_08350 [Mucilaginibacter terrae]|uniref:hypothetical protein n=1 Tax=Mucilaginibacter terrae TaxID=1955052 RepID=UPI00364344D7
MNRSFIKNYRNKSRTLTYFIGALFAILVYSCKKDFLKNTDAVNHYTEGITKLKEIYEKETRLNTTSGYQTNAVNNTAADLIHAKSVNWDRPALKQRSASKVTEFVVNEDSIFLALKQFKPGERINYRNKTSAVFIEKADGSRLNFYMKVIEEIPDNYSIPVINEVKYNQIPYRFNGIILYYNFNKTFINGYRVKNGNAVEPVSITTNLPEENKSTLNYKKLTEPACTVTAIYDSWCEWAESTVNGHYNYSFNGCHQTIVGYETRCPSYYINPPLPPGVTGDPNYNPNQYEPSKVIKDNATVKANPKIDCILSKIGESNNAYARFLAAFIQDNGYTVEFVVDEHVFDYYDSSKEVNASTNFNSKSQYLTVHLNGTYMNNSSAIDGARTIIHEMAHIYISQKVIQAGLSSSSLAQTLRSSDPYLYDLYSGSIDPATGLAKSAANNPVQHEYMATMLSYDIALGIKDFVRDSTPDNLSHYLLNVTMDDYLAMAFFTMEGTQGYNLYLASTLQTPADVATKVQNLRMYAPGNCP